MERLNKWAGEMPRSVQVLDEMSNWFSYKADPQNTLCTVSCSEEQHMKVGRPEIQKKGNGGNPPPSITAVFSLILSLLQSDT